MKTKLKRMPVVKLEAPKGLPSGGYTAVRMQGGRWAIRRVPIMLELPEGARFNKERIAKDWMMAAWEKDKAREAEDGYLGPVHIDHHGFLNTESAGAGYFRIVDVAQMKYEGKDTWAVFADILNLKPEAYSKIKACELPYRSVEIHDWDKPEINSFALMEHHVPFFRMAMLQIAEEVDASEGTADEGVYSGPTWLSAPEKVEKFQAQVADACKRGFISLAALGKPNGVTFLQEIRGFGAVLEEKDEDGPPAKKAVKKPSDEGADPDKNADDEDQDTDTPEGKKLAQDTYECVVRIEKYLTGQLIPDESSQPAEQEENPDKNDSETSKMTLEERMKAMEAQQTETQKQLAAAQADAKRAQLKLAVVTRLQGTRVSEAQRTKVNEMCDGANLAEAEVKVNAFLDGVLSAIPAAPVAAPVGVKKPAVKPAATAAEDPAATFEDFEQGASDSARTNLPAEVLAYQAQGPKRFDEAVDLFQSWKQGRALGLGGSKLKEFLQANMKAVSIKVKASSMGPDPEEDDEVEEETTE